VPLPCTSPRQTAAKAFKTVQKLTTDSWADLAVKFHTGHLRPPSYLTPGEYTGGSSPARKHVPCGAVPPKIKDPRKTPGVFTGG